MKKIAWEKIEDKEFDLGSEVIDQEAFQALMEEEDINGDVSFELFPSSKVKTPFGVYEFDDAFSPYKMFDCWICHTNFPITALEALILDDQIPGVGAFKVLSKYRFCIGIEKLFSITEVRESIHKTLCGDDDVSKEARKIDAAMSKIRSHDNWAIFIGESGEIVSSSTEIDGDLHAKNVSSMKKRKGGKLIICEKR